MAGELVRAVGGQRRQGHRSPKDREWLGEQVLALRNHGYTMPMVGKELDLPIATCYRYMDLVLAHRIPPTVDEFRKQQNDRLDETQREIVMQLDAANMLVRKAAENDAWPLLLDALKERDRALALQLRLDERRAKLNGIDAPIRVDATVNAAPDPREEELAQMVREAKARMAAERGSPS